MKPLFGCGVRSLELQCVAHAVRSGLPGRCEEPRMDLAIQLTLAQPCGKCKVE